MCNKQGVQRHGCSKIWENRRLSIEKIGKIGNFVLKNRRKINSTFVDKDSLPAPHQGYNRYHESSDSTFAGLRSTFAAKKE